MSANVQLFPFAENWALYRAGSVVEHSLSVDNSFVFAIPGLRNLYFLLSGAVDRFHLLGYGLGIVFVVLGLNMTILNRLWDGHFRITVSLAIIGGVIAASITQSLLYLKAQEEPRRTWKTTAS